MFDTEKIKELNELELTVYQFLLQNWQTIDEMTIREFSQACHVSTTTILRAIHKLGYQGYGELKYALKQKKEREQLSMDEFYTATVQVGRFLKKVNQSNYRQVVVPALTMIREARHVAFSGVGTSLHLASYVRDILLILVLMPIALLILFCRSRPVAWRVRWRSYCQFRVRRFSY